MHTLPPPQIGGLLDWLAAWRYDQRATMVVWAEFSNLGGATQSTASADAWLKRVELAARPPLYIQPFWQDKTGIVSIHSQWTFQIRREFDKPYVKRMHATRSANLSRSGWAQAVVGRVDAAAAQYDGGLRVSSQLQAVGGRRCDPARGRSIG